MPTIHLQVCAGFCNRIRALVSGICLAEDLNMPLVIHWFPNSPECVCRFMSVLDGESLPKTVKVIPEDTFQTQEVKSREQWNVIYQNWDKKSDLYIKSYSIFYSNENYDKHLRNLRPSRQVKEFLDRRCSSVIWNEAIGIHIRRGDHTAAIQNSPTEHFFTIMRKDKETFYVVCTDDMTVRKQMEVEFGDRCVFPALVLTRKSEEGMIQGVADFFALTKCSKIIGSSGSSFCEIAARYGNSELTRA